MNIISINVNGLRAFTKKGGMKHLTDTYNPDIICFQEIKCPSNDVKKIATSYGFLSISNPNKIKRGYAGVAIMYRPEIQGIKGGEVVNLSSDPYMLGRVVRLDFETFSLFSVYTLNSGGKKDLRKEWDNLFLDYVKQFKRKIITGDLNVCHTALDHHDWVKSKNTMPGLMEFEINGFSRLIESCNLIDSFRELNPYSKSYTWFPNFNTLKLMRKNKGWRLDYFLVSEELMNRVQDVKNLNSIEDKISDHLPIQLIFK